MYLDAGVDDVDKGDGLKGEGGSSMEVVSLPEERETDKGNEKQKLNDEETDRPAGIGAAGCFFSHFFAQGRIVSKPIETDLLSARRYFSIPLTSSESSNLRPGTGGNSDPSASSSSSSSVPMTHTNITEGADNDPQALQFNGAGRGFLSALADIWLAGTIRGDGELLT